MDNQTLFDNAYKGLASQGFERSFDDEYGCMYRSPDGKRCALGWSMNDDEYNWLFEGRDVSAMQDEGLFSSIAPGFAKDLQKAHDYSLGPEHMKSRLEAFARLHNLTIPVLENSNDR